MARGEQAQSHGTENLHMYKTGWQNTDQSSGPKLQTDRSKLQCKQSNDQGKLRVYKRQTKAANKGITRSYAQLDAVFSYLALGAYLMT